LGQDGIAKSFGRDAGAIGDEKNGAFGHACNLFQWPGST
jgi:hypothetical protein